MNNVAQYRIWIYQASQSHGVPSDIALAVAQRESGLRQYWNDGTIKVGDAGEIGMFQVKPSTAPSADLRDPEQNIGAGVGYLEQLYRRYQVWNLAIAAYTWGPSRVDDVLRGVRSVPSQVYRYVAGVLGEGAAKALPQGASYARQNTGKAPPGMASGLGVALVVSGLVFLLWEIS
jgi:soluble lytic murein transglycosylase-like protein